MPRHRYTKTPSTPEEIVSHLQDRGLMVSNPAAAASEIYRIGYSHIRSYFLSRRMANVDNRPFIPGTKFEEIIRIYECDAELRVACFAATSRLEILLRSRIAEVLADSHPYDREKFKTQGKRNKILKRFKKVYKIRSDDALKHYKSNYYPRSKYHLPTIWLMKEAVSFEMTAKFLFSLDTPVVAKVARDFGLETPQILESWVPSILDLRNMCAHHDRIFNRKFQKQPEIYKNKNIPTNINHRNRLRAQVESLDYLLNSHGSPIGLEETVKRILSRYPEVNLREVGFDTLGWRFNISRLMNRITRI